MHRYCAHQSTRKIIVGYIIVSSHRVQEVPIDKRRILETIAVQVGNVIQRIVSEKKYRSIFENAVEGIFQSYG